MNDETSSAEYVDQTVLFSDCLARAEAGDVLEAKESLDTIAYLLSSANVHPTTGEPLPLPVFVREYLARAFYQMSVGVAPSNALHLKKSSPTFWKRREKLSGASLVAQFVGCGLTVDAAASAAEDEIKRLQDEREHDGLRRPRILRGVSVKFETLRAWYFKYKNEIGKP